MPTIISFSQRAAFCTALLCALTFWFVSSACALPKTDAELRKIQDSLTETTIKHGDIPSLFNPPTFDIVDAANAYEADEQMLLVAFPTGIRMYPQSILVWHQVVNEFIKGRGYVVTYCPISGAFAAYESRVDNVSLVFDAEGRLFDNNSVLIDRNTGSLWLQLAGIAFDGPLKGKGLKQLPVMWTDWKHARKAFPDAQVLAKPRGMARSYGRDPYGSYTAKDSYYQNEWVYYPLTQGMDIRMPPKTNVIGFEVENLSFAVDIEYVKEKKAVNFFLGPYPLLAAYDDTVGTVRVYNRMVWGEPLLYRMKDKHLVDVETETTWSLDGWALEGNLKGASMEPLFGVYAFWFAWAAFYPDTIPIPGPTVVPDSALVKGTKK